MLELCMGRVTQTSYLANRLRLWSDPIKSLIRIFAVLALLASASVFAQGSSGGMSDAAVARTQNMVEDLFESGEYERAFRIYKEDLAPIGDKYAQYMVGFMYLMGTGVDEDPVMASAWYRLAAESTYPELLEVRDHLMNGLTEVDRLYSDQLFLQLRRQFSDAVLLLRVIEDDLIEIDARTGSRLSGSAGSVTIFDPNTGRGESSDAFYRRLENRIKSSLERLDKLVGLDGIDMDPSDLNFDELKLHVHQWVETINDY